jgi:hypothetical protein
MAGWRQAVEVAMTDEDVGRLMAISRSRTEPASRVERAQMLLAYRCDRPASETLNRTGRSREDSF